MGKPRCEKLWRLFPEALEDADHHDDVSGIGLAVVVQITGTRTYAIRLLALFIGIVANDVLSPLMLLPTDIPT